MALDTKGLSIHDVAEAVRTLCNDPILLNLNDGQQCFVSSDEAAHMVCDGYAIRDGELFQPKPKNVG